MTTLSNIFSCLTVNETVDPLIQSSRSDSSSSSVQEWRKLNGEDHWKGLLRPLNTTLRRHIIHYGEMAQATNDAFNRDHNSKHAGQSRYSKEQFFERVRLDHHNSMYDVTKFIYSTSELERCPEGLVVVPVSREGPKSTIETNWMGYVAVAKDEAVAELGRRDVVVAWRGSVQPLEWICDFTAELVAAPDVVGLKEEEVVLHKGFHLVYTSENHRSNFGNTSARNQILEEIKRVVELYKEEEMSITITGHSLGAAQATLTAVDIVTNNLNHRGDSGTHIPVTAIVFGSPKVGNAAFKKIFSDREREGTLRLLRVKNKPDVVPKVPPTGYEEVGEEVVVDSRQSQYLKPAINFHNLHNLEVYLHCVAGDQNGRWWKRRRFELVVKRSVALVNKKIGNLKEEYMVPEGWWVEENKGMVLKDDGSWVDMGYAH